MVNQVFGEVSWEAEIAGGLKGPQKDLFLRLEDGSNEMRLITNPYQYLIHKYKPEGSAGFGQKISCSALNGSCPLCDAGDKAKPRWLFGAISRKGGVSTYKILDISYAVFSQIRTHAKSKYWGDPTKYDLDVTVNKLAPPNSYYTATPIGKSPLSATDQVIKDNIDFDDLKRRSTPPTLEFVQKRIEKINAQLNGTFAPAATAAPAHTATIPTKAAAKPTTAPVSLATDDDDLDSSFPSYDGV